jgi:diacylglycerol O-acyltransferase / wax synthase
LSNMDVLGFGFIACRELMPELWELSDAVAPALAELVEAADKVTGSGKGAKRPAAAPAGG